MAASGTFKVVRRDLVLIFWQIWTLQCMFYWTLTTVQSMADWWLDVTVDVGRNFAVDLVSLRSTPGVASLVVNATTSLLCAYLIRVVVCKAKMCLDFAFTMYFVHFLACCYWNGAVPSSLAWWLLQVFCVTTTTILSEYLCMQVELRDIPVSLVPATQV